MKVQATNSITIMFDNAIEYNNLLLTLKAAVEYLQKNDTYAFRGCSADSLATFAQAILDEIEISES